MGPKGKQLVTQYPDSRNTPFLKPGERRKFPHLKTDASPNPKPPGFVCQQSVLTALGIGETILGPQEPQYLETRDHPQRRHAWAKWGAHL